MIDSMIFPLCVNEGKGDVWWGEFGVLENASEPTFPYPSH
jgi:hypothetical protein